MVTGAAGGIGSAIVRSLAAQGATVHGLDRDLDGQMQLAAELEPHGCFVPHEVDFSDSAAADRVTAALIGALAGRCDILVNNAGVSRVRYFAETDDELLDYLFAANFRGAFRLTRALLPALKASGSAAVVNIASELALVGQAGYSAYCATKGAVLAWSRALAVELVTGAAWSVDGGKTAR